MEEPSVRVEIDFIDAETYLWSLSIYFEDPRFSFVWTIDEPYLYTYDELMDLTSDTYMLFEVDSDNGRGDGRHISAKIPSVLVRDKLRAELDQVVPAGYEFAG